MLYTCIVCFSTGKFTKYRNVKTPQKLISNLEMNGKDLRFMNVYSKKNRRLVFRYFGYKLNKLPQYF